VRLHAEIEKLPEQLLASAAREWHRAVLDVLRHNLKPAALVALRLPLRDSSRIGSGLSCT
jgi:hypothetical protein